MNDVIDLFKEENKKLQSEYLDSLKAKCKLQIFFGENAFETYVVVNDRIVGCIQKILVDVDSENQLNRKIEIAFPKIGSIAASKELREYAKELASLGFVNVVYKDVIWENPKVKIDVEKIFAASSDADFENSDADFEKSLAFVRGSNEQGS